jgi:hypothetical protein
MNLRFGIQIEAPGAGVGSFYGGYAVGTMAAEQQCGCR